MDSPVLEVRPVTLGELDGDGGAGGEDDEDKQVDQEPFGFGIHLLYYTVFHLILLKKERFRSINEV